VRGFADVMRKANHVIVRKASPIWVILPTTGGLYADMMGKSCGRTALRGE
jgi:hypothetical protein